MGTDELVVYFLETGLLSSLPPTTTSKHRRSYYSLACRTAATLKATAEKAAVWRRTTSASHVTSPEEELSKYHVRVQG